MSKNSADVLEEIVAVLDRHAKDPDGVTDGDAIHEIRDAFDDSEWTLEEFA